MNIKSGFNMGIQRALELRRGDRVTAMYGWFSPERITRGATYQLTDDPDVIMDDGKLIGVVFPIVDDSGRTSRASYHGFTPV